MCLQKGNTHCSLLGTDENNWSRHSPLPRPEGFDESWTQFKRVLILESEKEYEKARSILNAFPGRAEQEWFDRHAQNAGEWRRKVLKKSIPTTDLSLDPIKVFTKYFNPILKRDNFRCRYCAHTVIPKKRLKSVHSSLGAEAFPLSRKNSELSGHYLVLCATLDHVVPHSLGGKTDEENLVTSCWPCNYGKMNYTLEQIGLDDPRSRPPLPLEMPIGILTGQINGC